jgi:hypothetical protein
MYATIASTAGDAITVILGRQPPCRDLAARRDLVDRDALRLLSKRDFPRTLMPAVLTDGLFSIWLVRQWRLCGS